jgi:hydrogenase maturation protease
MTRVLVAGIGNIFLGDDGFGVEVVQRLAQRAWPAGVRVADFGIRGYDLALALADDDVTAILVDALPRGGTPGTLYVVEPDLDRLAGTAGVDPHSLDPVQVLRFAKTLGGRPRRVLVVGCEPATLGEDEGGVMGLSAPVAASLAEAVRLVAALVEELHAGSAALSPATHYAETGDGR